jgi:hypothetical protein
MIFGFVQLLFEEAVFLGEGIDFALEILAVGQGEFRAGQFQLAAANALAHQGSALGIGGENEEALVVVDGGGVIGELGVAKAAQFIMGGGGAGVGFQGLFELLRGGFEFLAVDQVAAALEVGVAFLVLMIVVSGETTAQTGRDQHENGAVKNRPQTFHSTSRCLCAGCVFLHGSSLFSVESPCPRLPPPRRPLAHALRSRRSLRESLCLNRQGLPFAQAPFPTSPAQAAYELGRRHERFAR